MSKRRSITTTTKEVATETKEVKSSKWEYTPKKGEETNVYVEQEKEQYDRITGKKISQRHNAWYSRRSFEFFQKYCRQLGFTHVRVLYAPDGIDTSIPPMPQRKV